MDWPSITLMPQPLLSTARMLAVAAAHGCGPPDAAELAEARDLATRLMDHEVAPLEVYRGALAGQPSAILVFRQDGRVTGVFGALLLAPAALDRILDERFDALAPDLDLLTRDGGRPGLAYNWGVAAETKAAAVAVLGAAGALTRQLFPDITAFTRAVTGAGRHIALKRYGYRPLRGPDDNFLIKEPVLAEVAA